MRRTGFLFISILFVLPQMALAVDWVNLSKWQLSEEMNRMSKLLSRDGLEALAHDPIQNGKLGPQLSEIYHEVGKLSEEQKKVLLEHLSDVSSMFVAAVKTYEKVQEAAHSKEDGCETSEPTHIHLGEFSSVDIGKGIMLLLLGQAEGHVTLADGILLGHSLTEEQRVFYSDLLERHVKEYSRKSGKLPILKFARLAKYKAVRDILAARKEKADLLERYHKAGFSESVKEILGRSTEQNVSEARIQEATFSAYKNEILQYLKTFQKPETFRRYQEIATEFQKHRKLEIGDSQFKRSLYQEKPVDEAYLAEVSDQIGNFQHGIVYGDFHISKSRTREMHRRDLEEGKKLYLTLLPKVVPILAPGNTEEQERLAKLVANKSTDFMRSYHTINEALKDPKHWLWGESGGSSHEEEP